MNRIRKPTFHAAIYNRVKCFGSDVRSRPLQSAPRQKLRTVLDKDEAEVLFWQKMLEPFDRYGRMDVNAYMESFIRV